MQRASAADRGYPPALFFYQGTVEDGEWLLDQTWPEARAVSDADKQFNNAFGLTRGKLWQMLGWKVLRAGIRAYRRGYRQGKVVGDPWLLPGVFLVRGDEILWEYRYDDAGDHPDFTAIPY